MPRTTPVSLFRTAVGPAVRISGRREPRSPFFGAPMAFSAAGCKKSVCLTAAHDDGQTQDHPHSLNDGDDGQTQDHPHSINDDDDGQTEDRPHFLNDDDDDGQTQDHPLSLDDDEDGQAQEHPHSLNDDEDDGQTQDHLHTP
ncbi:hypothetical protein NDU88_006988 [Pleurodeles waltl]|uniref:Uncharacterized protein n=1 Tax=Pleurodeles waltl TaxID=8319 RepID=A0AAV7LQR9_PLEWA|nr:hypothetical protein NDU88_006988 [Pleurodeles waltl]